VKSVKLATREEEKGVPTLAEIYALAEASEIKRAAKEMLRGKTPTQYVRDLRRELSEKYSIDELADLCNSVNTE